MKDGEINGTSEMKLTVTFVLNASFSWWETPSNGTSIKNYGDVIVLCVLAFCSCVLNSCILLAISKSYSLKRIPLNSSVVGLSACCLLEAGFLVPVSAYFAAYGGRTCSAKLCAIDSTILLLVSLLISWEVSAMCLERWIAVVQRSQRSYSITRRKVVTVTAWICGILVTLPVFLGFTDSHYVPNRLSCSVTGKKRFYCVFLILAVQILLSVFAFTTILITLIRRYHDKRDAKSHAHELSYTERFFEESYFRNEWKNTKFVLFIFTIYTVLQLPHIFSQYYMPLYGRYFQVYQHNNTHQAVYAKDSILLLDKYFTWLRYSFLVIFPLVVLATRKDIRRKCEFLIFNCKGSALQHNASDVESHSFGEPLTDSPTEQDFINASKSRKRSVQNSLTTPIYFDSSKFRLLDVPGNLLKSKAKRPEDLAPFAQTSQQESVPYLSIEHCFVNMVDTPDSQLHSQLASYEDITEEEIYLSDDIVFEKHPTPVKEVAVQTINILRTSQYGENSFTSHQQALDIASTSADHFSSPSNVPPALKSEKSVYKPHPNPLAKLNESKNNPSYIRIEGGLSSVLKMEKTGISQCVVLPRSTAELLDAVDERRDATSL